MKKEVTIRTENHDIWLMAVALDLKSKFIKTGFETFGAFSSIMRQYLEKYNDEQGKKKLLAWWNIRTKDLQINVDAEFVLDQLKDINCDVETVIEKLKHE
ncbi:hypothetical protein ACOKFD_15785 [Flagellimonas sp. S174]|uniref:hypothetical protein n=1 Tax=Flagellimonas sp. S174 TaxID=3410790 RepID=UPI003BF4ECFE